MNIRPEMTQHFYQTINVLLRNVYGHSEEEGFALVNIMGQIIMANKVFCDASGYSEKEVLQLTAPDFFSGDLNSFIELVNEAKSGRIEWKNRIMLGKDKCEINVDVFTNYLEQGTGLFCCFFRFKDVDKNTHVWADQSKKELIENILNTVSTVFFITNEQFNVSYVSPSIESLTGYNQSRFSEAGFWQSIIHPEDIPTINSLLKYSPASPSYQVSFRIQNSNGEYIWLINSGRLEFDEKGWLLSAVGTLERIQNFNPFIKEDGSTMFYIEQLMNNLNLIFFAVSRQGIVLSKNNIFDKELYKLGFPPIEVGQRMENLYPGDDITHEQYMQLINRCLNGETINEIVNHKGVQLYFSMTPLKNNNEIEGVAILQQDRTRELAISDELARAATALSGIIDSKNEFIWAMDSNLCFSYFNKGFYDFHVREFGYEPVIGQRTKVGNMDHPITKQMIHLYELGYSGNTASEEIVLGDETAEIRVNPMHSDNNEIIGIALYARDISKLKRSQSKLIESEKRYKDVVNSVNEIIFQTDNDGHWTFLNEAWERVMGFSVDESIGNLFFNYLHPDDVQRNWELFEPLIARKKTYCSHMIRYVCKNGDIRQIHVYAVLLTNEKNEITGTSGTLQDITEQLRNKEMYQILSENVRDMIMIHDVDCFIKYVTPSCLNVVGYETEDLIGKDPFDFYHPDDIRGLRQVQLNYKDGSGAINNTISYRFLHKNGNYIWLETSSKNIQDIDGKTISIISSSRNIDERKKLEESLIESLVKEKELNELKSRFVSMASHEFRTPMATIKSSTEILEIRYRDVQDKALKDSTDRHLKIINSEIDRLTDLMNDVLLLGKIEANKVTFHPETVNIEEVVRDVIARQEEKQKDLRKVRFILTGESRKVMIDPKQFNHILDNLISNAYKYSENARSPELSLSYEEKKFIIEVRDFGIGIPKDERRQIFESFFRARNADLIQGTGLGLVIVKNFVTMHGGKVSFREAEQLGTIFKVEIPG